MRSRFKFGLGLMALGLSLAVLVPTAAEADSNNFNNSNRGLTQEALDELHDAGVDKYLGKFTPAASEDVGDGWVKHTFDPDGGDGPVQLGAEHPGFRQAHQHREYRD